MTVISGKFGSGEQISVRTDFARPETPVEYKLDDDDWKHTPFQAAQFYQRGFPDAAAVLEAVIRWLD